MTPPDRRRPLRGVSPRPEFVPAWGVTGGVSPRRADQLTGERRAFILRLLNTDITWTTYGMVREQVEAYFGSAPSIKIITRDLQQIGAVRVPLRPKSNRTKIVLLEGHTPSSLQLELIDRFAVDVLRAIRHESFVVLDTSRGVTAAVAELLKLASSDGLLPTHLAILHDGDDTVVVLCTSNIRATEWKEKLDQLLLRARPSEATG